MLRNVMLGLGLIVLLATSNAEAARFRRGGCSSCVAAPACSNGQCPVALPSTDASAASDTPVAPESVAEATSVEQGTENVAPTRRVVRLGLGRRFR